MIKKYKEGYRKVPESVEEIKALTKMSAEAFAGDAWSDCSDILLTKIVQKHKLVFNCAVNKITHKTRRENVQDS